MLSADESSCAGSSSGNNDALPCSCSVCQPLVASLTRQAEAMERLAELLPQLVAANMALVEALAGDDDEGHGEPQYL